MQKIEELYLCEFEKLLNGRGLRAIGQVIGESMRTELIEHFSQATGYNRGLFLPSIRRVRIGLVCFKSLTCQLFFIYSHNALANYTSHT